jgi:thiamine-monophosphate kinase
VRLTDPAEFGSSAELRLISRILSRLPPGRRPGEGPGDDAAVVSVGSAPLAGAIARRRALPERSTYGTGGESEQISRDGFTHGKPDELPSRLLFCIDGLVEGIHFDRRISTPFDVGWKAVSVNLSDIAAMGGRPLVAVVSVSAPTERGPAVIEEVMEGAAALSESYGVQIVGGDVSEGPSLHVVVAVLGALPEGRAPVTRTGARAGQLLLVTGVLGEASFGLKLGLSGRGADSEFVIRHRRPEPRLAEGEIAAAAGATSMIDISDGLILDAYRLAAASGVRLAIDLRSVPTPDISEMSVEESMPEAGGSDSPRGAVHAEALRHALAGGDDYELLFTLDREKLAELEKLWSDDLAPFAVIGTVEEGEGVEIFPDELVPPGLREGGWQHFAGQPSR